METIQEDADSNRRWIDFSCFSETSRMLMEDITDGIEKELGDKLYITRTPSNVTRFFGPKGNAEGSVVLRAGKSRSKVCNSFPCPLNYSIVMRVQMTNNSMINNFYSAQDFSNSTRNC